VHLSAAGQEQAIAAVRAIVGVRREQVIVGVRREQVIVGVRREQVIAAVRREPVIAAVPPGLNLPRRDSR
jgi:hypothetical protein